MLDSEALQLPRGLFCHVQLLMGICGKLTGPSFCMGEFIWHRYYTILRRVALTA